MLAALGKHALVTKEELSFPTKLFSSSWKKPVIENIKAVVSPPG